MKAHLFIQHLRTRITIESFKEKGRIERYGVGVDGIENYEYNKELIERLIYLEGWSQNYKQEGTK